MSQTIVNINQAKILNQLDTYNHTALLTSMYKVAITLTEQPPSGMSIAIKQNGSTVVTSTAPSSTQGHVELQTILNCAASDTIGVVISSSNANDQGLNSIRGTLTINPGLV
jgi:hypothetical protein